MLITLPHYVSVVTVGSSPVEIQSQSQKVKLRRPRGTRPSGHIAAVGVSVPPFPDLGTQ